MIDVYGFGNALVDYEFLLKEQDLNSLGIQKGLMTLIEEPEHNRLLEVLNQKVKNKASGGSAANTIMTLQALGSTTFYSCRVAQDEAGEQFVRELKELGIANNFLYQDRPQGITGKCLVLVTEDGERSMQTFLGATAQVGKTELHLESLKKSKFLYIEGYLVASPSALEAALIAREEAEKAGVKTSLTFSDPNMVSFFKDQMKQIIGKGLDLIFCNENEAYTFLDVNNIQDAAYALKSYAKTFVITCSEKGSVVFDGTSLNEVPTREVKAVDSTGAGDAFAGAFLYALLQKRSYKQAASFANQVAAQIVSQYGPRLSAGQLQALKSKSF